MRFLQISVLLLGIGSCVLPLLAHPPADATDAPSQVTFNRDIAPIVFRSCSTCHRPGEAAPFSLLNYSDVKKHARQIADVTRLRAMPPWLPEPQALKFKDEMRLSDAEIRMIERWVEQGEVEGNPADLPAQPKFVEGWRLGKPDMILTATKPLILPPQGTDTYWNFIFPVPITETRWVKAVEIRPGDKRYVHHANILVDRTGASRKRESEPGAGFGGMEIRIESQVFGQSSSVLETRDNSVSRTRRNGAAARQGHGSGSEHAFAAFRKARGDSAEHWSLFHSSTCD
jgi:mono/diheme cytochrome c family protein